MFALLESKEEIESAQYNLKSILFDEFMHKENRNISYRPRTERDALVSKKGDYWYKTRKLVDNDGGAYRYLNWFGKIKSGNLHISVEINSPIEGCNRRVAGYFAKNLYNGTIYLMHSGRIGGGAKGVGKDGFLAWSNHKLNQVIDSTGAIRLGIVVMPIKEPAEAAPLIEYIDSIVEYKQLVQSNAINFKSNDFKRRITKLKSYYDESSGRRTGIRSSKIDYISRHGDVVKALKHWREQNLKNLEFEKDVFIDLGLRKKSGNRVELYEVKTSTRRSDIYSAIGQLVTHGLGNCKKFILLPYGESIADDLHAALQSLAIKLIHFKLTKNKVTIIEED